MEEIRDFTEPVVLCPHCLEKHPYTIHERITKALCPRNNRQVEYNEWYAICDECGEETYVSWIEERNIEEFYAMTRVDDFIEYLKNKYTQDCDDKLKMYNKSKLISNQEYWRGRADEVQSLIQLLPEDFEKYLEEDHG